MVGEDFTYGNYSLSDFDLIMIQPENEDTSGLNREIIKGSTTIERYEANHYGAKYSEVFTPNFFVIKNPCNSDSDYLSDDELRDVYSWLTYCKLPSSLFVEFEENSTKEFVGLFTEIVPYVVNGVNGLKLVFTCNSPFGYEDNSLVFNNNISDYSKIFNCTSDENTYIYPIIRIKPAISGDSADYSIENQDEGKTMEFTLSSSYVEYVFDCKYKRIFAYDSNNNETTLSLSDVEMVVTEDTDFSNYVTNLCSMYWLRFSPGVNHLLINGNGEFNISCKSPIKVGGYPYD